MICSRIGFVAWPSKQGHFDSIIQTLQHWSHQHPRVKLFLNTSLEKWKDLLPVADDKTLRRCHALVAIGGDGTVLSTARLALGRNIPILGVNLGRVGFLADTPIQELASSLDRIHQGRFQTCPRTMLDYEIFQGRKRLTQDTVLNEVQIQAMLPERMTDLEVKLNQEHLTEFWADSLLVSTPTGSTAYNLSAGGPILHPATETLVLNPVNPFSLAVRPLVVSAQDSLSLQECNGKSVRIMADGQPGPILKKNQTLVLRISRHKTHFIQTTQAGFVEALRSKLGWTGKPKLKS